MRSEELKKRKDKNLQEWDAMYIYVVFFLCIVISTERKDSILFYKTEISTLLQCILPRSHTTFGNDQNSNIEHYKCYDSISKETKSNNRISLPHGFNKIHSLFFLFQILFLIISGSPTSVNNNGCLRKNGPPSILLTFLSKLIRSG